MEASTPFVSARKILSIVGEILKAFFIFTVFHYLFITDMQLIGKARLPLVIMLPATTYLWCNNQAQKINFIALFITKLRENLKMLKIE